MSKKKQKAPLESWHLSSNPLSVLEYSERDSWNKIHGKIKHLKLSGVSKILKNQAKKKRQQQKDYRPLKETGKIKVFSGGLPSLGKKR